MTRPPAPDDRGREADEWDERYGGAAQVWSGRPNGALVAETEGLSPGRALDVGCGEGADAIWLARQGWKVCAVDVSGVALERARAAARQAGVGVGVGVEWIHAGLLDAAPRAGRFDLVSAQYPALRVTADHRAEHALIDAVGPEGHLLVVHHLLDDTAVERARSHGCDPTHFVSPGDVASQLDDQWEIHFDDRRPRTVSEGAGAHHVDDVVLHAQRLG